MPPFFLLKSSRFLLWPFSLLYWLAVSVRNRLYDTGILKSTRFAIPIICVGNLSVGGTGKSPMVEYLAGLLRDRLKVATLSRGYKRRTKGYALAGPDSTALEIGDEPMQFHLKFPDIAVAVGEQRVEAIPQLLHDRPGTQVIILDDAFQHRSIRAGLNILLTDYQNLFTRDFYLPAGHLRDQKRSYRRADILVVTKCPPDMDGKEKEKLVKEVNPRQGQLIFFTTIDYGEPYHLLSHEKTGIGRDTGVLLVSGIASPGPLKKRVGDTAGSFSMLQYPDHHIFTIDDLDEIRKKFDGMDMTDKIVLTTEKDAVRLFKFNKLLNGLPLYVLPVRHRFLFAEGEAFNDRVTGFIYYFKPEGVE